MGIYLENKIEVLLHTRAKASIYKSITQKQTFDHKSEI